jgi:hypothetical protein
MPLHGWTAGVMASGRVLAVTSKSAADLACVKTMKAVVITNLSCVNGSLFESILRPNEMRKGFHTTKTQTGSAVQ